MKNRIIFSTMLFLTFGTFILIAEVKNSHHDFSGAVWNNYEICIVCHTPHNANSQVADAPLWNHEVTVASYQTYNSPTLDATVGQPSGISKLCLSCHDGTVAVDSHSGNAGGSKFVGFAKIGTDLQGEHPISFTYNSALTSSDIELHDPSSTPSGLGGTIEEDLLINGKVECSTCHDVHVSRNTAGCTGCHQMFPMKTTSLSLRIPNDKSAFCLTCHNK